MIYRQLSKYSLLELKDAILSIPLKNLIYALFASFVGYIALSTYDYLALKYIKKKRRPHRHKECGESRRKFQNGRLFRIYNNGKGIGRNQTVYLLRRLQIDLKKLHR